MLFSFSYFLKKLFKKLKEAVVIVKVVKNFNFLKDLMFSEFNENFLFCYQLNSFIFILEMVLVFLHYFHAHESVNTI